MSKRLSVSAVARQLFERGQLVRSKQDQSQLVIEKVNDLIGQTLPEQLCDFYKERIARVAYCRALVPFWNPYVGWSLPAEEIEALKPHGAMPLFYDGCGNLFGLDLTAGSLTAAVYLFDHEKPDRGPAYAAGSSLAHFLLLLAERDRAFDEGRPVGWELKIDPDLGACPRAPPWWEAD